MGFPERRAAVAHRGIVQERFGFSAQSRSSSPRDDLSALIIWAPVAALLEPLYSATKGEPAWPPLGMFKALLLAVWYDLSDVKLAEALDDRRCDDQGDFRHMQVHRIGIAERQDEAGGFPLSGKITPKM
jgi:hypothetical protein